MGDSFLDRALASENVPSLPHVAIEVLALSKKASATADDLASIVQNDPAITARLLQIVNSALFGIPRKIGSVRQAISMMGVRSVTVTVLTFALVESIKSHGSSGVDLELYWKQGLSSAVAAKLIARRICKGLAEEAFVVGLLSDIGRMAAWSSAPEEYGRVCARAREEGRRLQDVEAAELGVDHAQISAALLRNWGLPDRMVAAVEAHHGRSSASADRDGSQLVSLARCAAMISGLFCGDICPTQIDAIKSRCAGELGINETEIEEMLVATGPGVLEAANALSVDVGTTVNYDQLKSEAALRLAGLTIEAEAERAKAAQREEAARSDAERLRAENRAMMEVASTDSLTKLHNRAAFDQALEKMLAESRSARRSLGVYFIDVDYFKQFNDLHGHQAGDKALRQVAEQLRSQLGADGFLARYGGEEFVAVVAGATEPDARRLAESLRASVQVPSDQAPAQPAPITISVGVAYSERWPDTASPDHVIRLADEQLYKAKRSGRNRVEFAAYTGAAAPRSTGRNPSAAA